MKQFFEGMFLFSVMLGMLNMFIQRPEYTIVILPIYSGIAWIGYQLKGGK